MWDRDAILDFFLTFQNISRIKHRKWFEINFYFLTLFFAGPPLSLTNMDHAVKRAAKGRPWNKLRFENDELECLYQRYTLKLQRFSVTGVVALVVVLCGVMAALSLVYNQAPTLHVSHLFIFGFFPMRKINFISHPFIALDL